MSRILLNFGFVAVSLSFFLFLSGCAKKETTGPAPDHDHAASTQPPAAGAHDHDEEEFHSHDHGPKGGILAILGAHQFHVEFIPDEETGSVTAYVYNDRFKPVALDSKELKLNIMLGGEPKQYALLVDHDGSDGKEAAFKITDADLAKLLKNGWEGKAQVSLNVKDAPHTGDLIPLKK